jgi:hypothetical protein
MTGLGGGLLYMHRKGRYGSYFKRAIRLAASPLSSRPQPPIARYEPHRRLQNLLYRFIAGPRYQADRRIRIQYRQRSDLQVESAVFRFVSVLSAVPGVTMDSGSVETPAVTR